MRTGEAMAAGEKSRTRIGVLTFHRSVNYGSYWQARCLVEGLAARGHDVRLLDHRSPRVTAAEWRCAFQPTLPLRTPRAAMPAYGRKLRRLAAAVDRLPLSRPFPLDQPAAADGVDAVVVGSDEVWNFRHPWFRCEPLFFGEGLPTRRLVSYAASFGAHDADAGMDDRWRDLIARFDAVSVRDDNSRRLIDGALGREPALVLDPCLQFPGPLPARPAPAAAPYVALYGHSFPDWFADRVRAAADALGLRVVSIGYLNDWADEQAIDADPVTFAQGMAGAAAVATDFFHGCVFALAYDRPFVAAASPYRRNKLRDLTAKLGATAHLVDAEVADYRALLSTPLAPEIARRIVALRAEGDRWLDSALG
jgi:hypothetical protein